MRSPPCDRLRADFETEEIRRDETTIFVRTSGFGPPILLLHGFPQTRLTADALGSFFATGRERLKAV
jgi:hypothetical protein